MITRARRFPVRTLRRFASGAMVLAAGLLPLRTDAGSPALATLGRLAGSNPTPLPLPNPLPNPVLPTNPEPLAVEAGAEAEFASLMGPFWASMAPQFQQQLVTSIASLNGTKTGQFTISNLSVASVDLSEVPGVNVTPTTNAQGQYSGEQIEMDLPGGSKGWTVQINGTVTYDIVVNLGFTTINQNVSANISVKVANLSAVEKIAVNTVTDPTWPTVSAIQHPTTNFNLTITTNVGVANAILSLLQPLFKPVIQLELNKLISQFDPVLNQLIGTPGTPFGSGGPAMGTFSPTTNLLAAALQSSVDIQTNHTPWGNVFETYFSSPVYGQGTPTSYADQGDSSEWTGCCLMAESLRYAATKDPNALVNAQKVLNGLQLCMDAEDPASGRIARFAIPVTSPFAQPFLPVGVYSQTFGWEPTVNGVQYICQDATSRDTYVGTMMGLQACYEYIDDPAIKAQAGALIDRVVDFLDSTGWNALNRDNTVSAPFIQSPNMIIAFTAAAEQTDPAKYSVMREACGRLASFDWIVTWTSALDVLMQYFKWDLGHRGLYTCLHLETDPDRYQHLESSFEIMRHAVGFHRNAWMDAVQAALDPSTRTQLGPQITDDLQRLVSRGKRWQNVTNSTDPTIQQATYTGLGLTGQTTPLTFMGTTFTLSQPPTTVAKYPIPVEKRIWSGYLWQEGPFDLDEPGDPHHESAGVDLILPYWLGVVNGFVK